MGQVLQINIALEHGMPPHEVSSVNAVAGKGLEGDRYFDSGKPHKAITLIASEALEHLEADTGIVLTGASSGRNLLTCGIDLNDLVGRRFKVGKATLEGYELCEPCRTLETYTQTGVIHGLTHRGGLRARVVVGGCITRGDTISTL